MLFPLERSSFSLSGFSLIGGLINTKSVYLLTGGNEQIRNLTITMLTLAIVSHDGNADKNPGRRR